jgi:hypothetical protein
MYDRIASTRPEGAMGNSKAVNHSTGRLISIRHHFVPEANQWAAIGNGMFVELVCATNKNNFRVVKVLVAYCGVSSSSHTRLGAGLMYPVTSTSQRRIGNQTS